MEPNGEPIHQSEIVEGEVAGGSEDGDARDGKRKVSKMVVATATFVAVILSAVAAWIMIFRPTDVNLTNVDELADEIAHQISSGVPTTATEQCPDVNLPESDGAQDVLVGVHLQANDLDCWTTTMNPAPSGQHISVMMSYKNSSPDNQHRVVARVNLPPRTELVPGTTWLKNGTNPDGVLYSSNNIATGGIVIGSYSPGGAARIKFDLALPFESTLSCGTTEFRLVGAIRPEGLNEYYNTAIWNVHHSC